MAGTSAQQGHVWGSRRLSLILSRQSLPIPLPVALITETILLPTIMKRRLIYFLLGLPIALLLLLETGLRLTRGEGEFPPVRARLTNDIPGVARTVDWSVGTDGLRKSGWEDGRPRMLCLGGDNTMPILQSSADTWWGVAGRQLQEQGAPVAMAAAGQSNQPSSSALRWIPHFANLAKPSIVVLSFGPGEVLYRPAGYRWEPGSLVTPIEMRPG